MATDHASVGERQRQARASSSWRAALVARGVEILSTGGTAQARSPTAASPSRAVSDYTGSPEILDGRVKTLHPKIHGGLLGRARRPAPPAPRCASTASGRSTWWS